ncbi:putative branched-chain-amino-acid aminotransferase [Nitrospina gracilis 3/211]|uniref:branched-chain-amino-acid transaminase n=1 Tax=Nitrospina gracilis (strain 3/211) TaxID=1266370 RepID=M1ZDM5_NITG3|nr:MULTISPECIES: aminotransferase class IV [Nitrospina]MCF8724428.1 branched-chain amino acid aminotransferase [Nitrospina sp. Nb-3]CCQ91585.1 putative branched-chain-amino-acid aminotransferase [Nitrospina gracilis 3/211]
MTIKINLNGTIDNDAFISVLDHGFLFGDSVYEVVSTIDGQVVFLAEHLRRLRQSAAALNLVIPYSDTKFGEEIHRTLKSAGNTESYVRIIVTRGVGELDLDPTSCTSPNVIILAKEAVIYPQENYDKGIHLALVSVKRNLKESLNPELKTGNYLNNVLAKMEANRTGAADALMLNSSGYLTECTTSNIFFVKDGRIFTPSLDCGILEGITREKILRLARENGFLVEEGEWPPEALEQAEEAFITGTVKKIMPVTLLNSRPVGNGKPGPTTKKLMRLYEDFLKRVLE